jgi:hypothetical protein
MERSGKRSVTKEKSSLKKKKERAGYVLGSKWLR